MTSDNIDEKVCRLAESQRGLQLYLNDMPSSLQQPLAQHKANQMVPVKRTGVSSVNKVLLGILLAFGGVVLFVLYNKYDSRTELPGQLAFYSEGAAISTSEERPMVANAMLTSDKLHGDLDGENYSNTQDATQEAPVQFVTSSTVVGNEQLEEVTRLTGKVGKLDATFNLVWADDGKVSGTYFNNKYPSQVYKLRGAETSPGRLELNEYTGNKKTATCILVIQYGCYDGTMQNTDGRSFFMRMCLD